MICHTCKQNKPETAFNWAIKGVKRQTMCRACFSEYNKQRYAADPKKYREQVRRYKTENVESVYQTRISAALHKPTKQNAHRAVEAALLAGHLVKPNKCSVCGCSDTLHRIEAHHEDYRQPLNVIWVCTPCHRQLDAVRRKKEGLKGHARNKAIQKLNDNGQVIAEYESQTEAARAVNRAPNSISQALKLGTRCGGYYWRRID